MNKAPVVLLWLLLAVMLASRARGASALDQLDLPPAPQAPWRFKQFPILAWWGPPGTASPRDFANYREAGFTIYLPNPDTGFTQAAKKASHAGLALMPFRHKEGFGLPRADHVRFPVDNPHVVGWVCGDEPKTVAQAITNIKLANKLMRRDPTRRALFNLLPFQKDPPTAAIVQAAARNGVPIISYDHYVLHADGTTNDVFFYGRLEAYRKLSLKYHMPLWTFGLTIKHFKYRRPSESDLRWKQFSNLAYGAKGLWYFTYWAPKDWKYWSHKAIVDATDGSKTELYGYVKAINDNVRSVGQTLLHLTSERVMHTQAKTYQSPFEKNKYWIADGHAADAIVSLFRHDDGTRYAMIVNKQHGPHQSAAQAADTVMLTFAPGVEAVTAVAWLDGQSGPLDIKNHRTKLRIAGGTGVLLRLEEKKVGKRKSEG